MSCGIYRIVNKINGKCYVGQSTKIEQRWKDHISELINNRHHNVPLQRAWNKYGACSFVFEILCLCDKEHLNDLETYWCNYYRPNVYNTGNTMSKGPVSEYVRKKITKKLIGHPVSQETREKFRKALTGRKHPGKPVSEETKRKLSDALRGRPSYVRTPEHRKMMSEKFKGHIVSEEARRKISETLKKRRIADA